MKLLFVNIPLVGHVNPTLVLVQELVKRGHEVDYILTEEWRDKIQAIGAKLISYQNFENVKNEEESNLRCYSAAYNTALEKNTDYDVLVYEAWFFLGETLGEKLEIPTVKLFSTFALNKDILVEFLTDSNNMRVFLNDDVRKWHTDILLEDIKIKERDFLHEIIFNIPKLNIICTSKWFQVDSQSFDQRYEFVGSMIPLMKTDVSIDLTICKNKPIIYISLGSIHYKHLDFYKSCINELGNTEYEVIFSIGKKSSIESLGDLPNNIHVYTYVPQKEVLHNSALFITHGGMNSVNESIYYGVPMIVIPINSDQPINAHRIEELNIGISMKMDEVDNKLYKIVKSILKDETIQKQIVYAQNQQINSGGVIKAADLIEEYHRLNSVTK